MKMSDIRVLHSQESFQHSVYNIHHSGTQGPISLNVNIFMSESTS